LSLVPSVTVTTQPHHQTLLVGVVLSTMGEQVIVEGVDNHNPLSEGSILWITECRSPLGVVDEIFGSVKNPYYIVRFNSERYDASGENEGELSEELEFSDDEKEAEYKKMIEIPKKGIK
ncbi:H/ACA ribonucleoprotein complex non-core subunit NAF1, partial [Tanacetum coccineum]